MKSVLSRLEQLLLTVFVLSLAMHASVLRLMTLEGVGVCETGIGRYVGSSICWRRQL